MPMTTKRQRRATELAELVRLQGELEAEETAHEKAVRKAVETAGYARAAAVDELYELLGIEPEKTSRKRADGSTVTVHPDRDETRRARRLVEAVQALLEQSFGTLSAPAGNADALAPIPPAPSEDCPVDGELMGWTGRWEASSAG